MFYHLSSQVYTQTMKNINEAQAQVTQEAKSFKKEDIIENEFLANIGENEFENSRMPKKMQEVRDKGTVSELSFKNMSNSTSNQDSKHKEKGKQFTTSIKYPFHTMQSRKKDKKKIRNKINKIASRVHNTDCLLKKIKAKYLKYLFLTIKEEASNIDTRKFDQCVEVRNLNINHNRHKFLNLTILQLLINNKVLTKEDVSFIEKNKNLNSLLNKKVKHHYQFNFLQSTYYKEWVKDPIKITTNNTKNAPVLNKNCLKYEKHSKNIFQNNTDHYQTYIKLLIITSTNFTFYFQNNPQKFGKKGKKLYD